MIVLLPWSTWPPITMFIRSLGVRERVVSGAVATWVMSSGG